MGYINIRDLRKVLKLAHERLRDAGGWRAVGKEYGVTGGMVWRIARQGYNPKTRKIRQKLGLSIMAESPVCPVHGIVHCFDCLTQEIKQRTNGHKKRPAKFKVYCGNVTDEERAAIMQLTPAERKAALLAELNQIKSGGNHE